MCANPAPTQGLLFRPGVLNNGASGKHVHGIRLHGVYTTQWGALQDEDSVGIHDTLPRQRDNAGTQHNSQCLYREPFMPIAQFYEIPEVTPPPPPRGTRREGGGGDRKGGAGYNDVVNEYLLTPLANTRYTRIYNGTRGGG